jgi:hypothetical protein
MLLRNIKWLVDAKGCIPLIFNSLEKLYLESLLLLVILLFSPSLSLSHSLDLIEPE